MSKFNFYGCPVIADQRIPEGMICLTNKPDELTRALDKVESDMASAIERLYVGIDWGTEDSTGITCTGITWEYWPRVPCAKSRRASIQRRLDRESRPRWRKRAAELARRKAQS